MKLNSVMRVLLTFLVVFLAAGFCGELLAQGPPTGGTGPGGPPPAPIPVDGGISLLVAAGVAYGVKKLRDRKKEQEQQVS